AEEEAHMKNTLRKIHASSLSIGALVAGAAVVSAHSGPDLRQVFDSATRYSHDVSFPATVGALGNVQSGQSNFGVAADGISEDKTMARFEGFSPFAGQFVSNQRPCFPCHRPGAAHFGLPSLPLHNSVPADDALFTGLVADTGTEPLGLENFDNLGLLFHRP